MTEGVRGLRPPTAPNGEPCKDSLLDTDDRTDYNINTTTNERSNMGSKRNSDVVKAWAAGRGARAANLSTDGRSLYSYGLCIGTTEGGRKVVRDYTSGGSHGWISQTTSCHVGLAKRFA